MEASLRGRQDFTTAFGEFDQWLTRIEKLQDLLENESSNPALLKNAAHRKMLLDNDRVSFCPVFFWLAFENAR